MHAENFLNTNTHGMVFGTACILETVQWAVTKWFNNNSSSSCEQNGWILLTTESRAAYWRSVFNDKKNRNENKVLVPTPHIHTHTTIGHLRAYVDLQHSKHMLLVVEHAELFVDMYAYIKPVIRSFNSSLLFTEHVGMSELCTLAMLIVEDNKDEATLRNIRSIVNKPPPDLHSAFFSPATRWLWHFLVVLFVTTHLKRFVSYLKPHTLQRVTTHNRTTHKLGGNHRYTYTQNQRRSKSLKQRKRKPVSCVKKHTSQTTTTVVLSQPIRSVRRRPKNKRTHAHLTGGGIGQRMLDAVIPTSVAERATKGTIQFIVDVIVGVVKGICTEVATFGRHVSKTYLSDFKRNQRNNGS